jgi:hypothetical protein
LPRQLTPPSQQFRRRGRQAAPTIAPTKFSRSDWARFFARAGNRFAGAASRSCAGGEAVYVEGGPIYDFLELVLKPLRAYLRERHLAPVTTETIVRLITDG